MIEKRNKFMSYSLEADLSGVCEVCAYIEDGTVVAYHHPGDSEVCIPKRCENFFDTEKEAEDYIRTRIAELRKAKKEISKIIWEVYYYESNYDCEHAVTLRDFCIPESPDKERKRKKQIEKMARCIRTRMIDIAGNTISLDDIERIEWGRNASEPVVLLSNGDRIKVDDWEETQLLKLIYEQ